MPPLLLALLQAATIAQPIDTVASDANVKIKASGGDTNFATAITSLGDINNDGFDDLLVANSTSGDLGGHNGMAWVYKGGNATPTVLFTYSGSVLDELGASIGGGGDFDNDGTPDFILGVPGSSNMTGNARVYSGRTGNLLAIWGGSGIGNRFGDQVSFFADVAMPAGDEVLVLYDRTNLNGVPETHVLSPDSTPSNPVYSITGKFTSNAGLINPQDQTPDIAAGFPLAAHGADIYAGHIKYYSGNDGSLLVTDDMFGPFGDAGEKLGGVVRFMGDVNNDQKGDVISSGAPFDNNRGRIRIVSGVSPLHDPIWMIDGAAQGDQFGESVANIGDYNGDGVNDFIVGAPFNDPVLFGQTVVDAGRAYLYSGATGTLLRTFTGDISNSHFGAAVSGAKDYNGDGVLDLAISAPGDISPANGTGVVYVFYLPCTSFADLNADGIVNGSDLSTLLVQMQQTCPLAPAPTCSADFNNDKVVDGVDLATLLVNWGTCMPTGAPAMAAEPGGGGMGSQSTMDPSGAPSQQSQSQSQSGQAYMLSIIAQFGFADLPSYYTWLETASDQELAATISAMIDAIARNEQ